MSLLSKVIDYSPIGMMRKPLKQLTGLSDAQLGGAGLLAVTGAHFGAPVFASLSQAGANAGGLLSKAGTVAGPIAQGLQVGQQVAALNQAQPMQPGQLQQRPGPDLSQFIAAEQQRNQMMDQERQKRMQQQQMALGGMLGGGYGRNA
mgnify:CR=1 FL=1